VETDSIPRQAREKNEGVDAADLVVGIVGEFNPEGVGAVCDALRKLAGSPRIAVLHDGPTPNLVSRNPDAGSAGASLFFLSQAEKADLPRAPLSVATVYESVFAAAEKLGARGCCVIASQIQSAPEWVCQLTQPLLDGELDLVVPRYAHRKFEGLLNSSIISPLMRSLYGKRIHNPLGPDLAVSQRLYSRVMTREQKSAPGGIHPLASLTPAAVCGNLNVCEAHIGQRVYAPTDWTNISSLLSYVLDPVFLEVEKNAACWQRVRGSGTVAGIGQPVSVSKETESVDVHRMLELFQLGNRELQEIWGLVLPPATLFELRKLLRLPPEQFRMDDSLWVRVVYDFALAHHLRTINRDHLLKSMTPLYLGWVASYTQELQGTGALEVENRLERLALAYESAKPYLVSRWRWPDRFSP
jgi:glucosylglycerate synthase